MKDNKHIKSFNEHQENLNISDVSDSNKGENFIKKLIGFEKYNYLKNNNDLSIIFLDKEVYKNSQDKIIIQFLTGPGWNKSSICDIEYKCNEDKWLVDFENPIIVNTFNEVIDIITSINIKNNYNWYDTGCYPIVNYH
jgi:hypothetical protein